VIVPADPSDLVANPWLVDLPEREARSKKGYAPSESKGLSQRPRVVAIQRPRRSDDARATGDA